jgi:hypothetical protein
MELPAFRSSWPTKRSSSSSGVSSLFSFVDVRAEKLGSFGVFLDIFWCKSYCFSTSLCGVLCGARDEFSAAGVATLVCVWLRVERR